MVLTLLTLQTSHLDHFHRRHPSDFHCLTSDFFFVLASHNISHFIFIQILATQGNLNQICTCKSNSSPPSPRHPVLAKVHWWKSPPSHLSSPPFPQIEAPASTSCTVPPSLWPSDDFSWQDIDRNPRFSFSFRLELPTLFLWNHFSPVHHLSRVASGVDNIDY